MNIQKKAAITRSTRREADPEGFWAEAAKEIDWIKPAEKVFDPARASMAAGSPAPWSTPATTRSTAMLPAAAPIRSR